MKIRNNGKKKKNKNNYEYQSLHHFQLIDIITVVDLIIVPGIFVCDTMQWHQDENSTKYSNSFHCFKKMISKAV